MEIYVVLPMESGSDYLACCWLNDVCVYASSEAADYAAHRLNKSRPDGAKYTWKAVEMDLNEVVQ